MVTTRHMPANRLIALEVIYFLISLMAETVFDINIF